MEQPLIQISFFQGLKKTAPFLRPFSVDEACTFFTPHFPPLVEKEDRQKEGHQFSFNIYKPGKTRGSDNVDSMTGIVLDFDNKDGDFVSIESVTDKLYAKRLIYWWYTTWSHTSSLPRWRLIIPFSQPLPKEHWLDVYRKMIVFLGSPPGIDPACQTVSHMWYPPFRCKVQPFQAQDRREGYLFNPLGADHLLSPLQRAEYEASQKPRNEKRAFLEEANVIDDREISELLQFIGADDYHDWVKVGMTLHHHFGGTMQGFSLWNEWSRRSSKYKGDADLHAHWRTFERAQNPVTLGTLIYLAQENGYRRPSKLESNAFTSRVSNPRNDAPEVLAEDREAEDAFEDDTALEEEDDTSEWDLDFKDFPLVDVQKMPTAFLKGLFQYLSGCSLYVNPVYALAATIVTGGFLMRKTLERKEKLSTNFMTLSIGPTGTGKTQVFQGIENLLIRLEQNTHLASKLISQQGIVDALKSKEACLFLLNDEAAYAAEAMKSKTISHHEMAVEELKLKLFNNPMSITPPCAKGADLMPIMRPFFCELATSTPNILTAFVPRDFTSGLLPRYFILHEKLRRLDENPNWTFDIPEGLVPQIRKHCTLASDETPERVFESGASELLKQFRDHVNRARDRVLDQPYSTSQEIHGASLTRLFEHAKKLAYLASVKDGARYVVSHEAMAWAINVVLLSHRNMREIIDNNIHENRTEQMRDRVLKIIQKVSKGKWVPKARTLQYITFLTRRELDDILIKLADEGMIEIRQKGKQYFSIRSTTPRERKKQ
jgi:hypothetical protein